jgi:hypothetical protein
MVLPRDIALDTVATGLYHATVTCEQQEVAAFSSVIVVDPSLGVNLPFPYGEENSESIAVLRIERVDLLAMSSFELTQRVDGCERRYQLLHAMDTTLEAAFEYSCAPRCGSTPRVWFDLIEPCPRHDCEVRQRSDIEGTTSIDCVCD